MDLWVLALTADERRRPVNSPVLLALAAFSVLGTPAKIAKALREHGRDLLHEYLESLGDSEIEALKYRATDLEDRGVSAIFLGDDEFPELLSSIPRPPGILFVWGNIGVLQESGIGMCGSRDVSEAGLAAASACGSEVARLGLAVFSGYAKGVDTATHIAALESDGHTAIVLAEGILNFRIKRVFDHVPLDEEHAVAISQFAPTQKWTVGGAMARNSVISGLSQALVVIEAGEKGGTLDAGLQALKLGRPVIALEFASTETPPGNLILLEKGARPVRTRQELGRVLEDLRGTPPSSQLSLI